MMRLRCIEIYVISNSIPALGSVAMETGVCTSKMCIFNSVALHFVRTYERKFAFITSDGAGKSGKES